LARLSTEFFIWLELFISRTLLWFFSKFLYLYWIPFSFPALSSLFHSGVLCPPRMNSGVYSCPLFFLVTLIIILFYSLSEVSSTSLSKESILVKFLAFVWFMLPCFFHIS
jgi:hypothetical protein